MNTTDTSMTWLETRWEDMYEGRNPLLVTGLFAFAMHELVYFGRFLPFLICDFIPYFEQYKLQPVSKRTRGTIWPGY
jgi:methylsterol monooxygenase